MKFGKKSQSSQPRDRQAYGSSDGQRRNVYSYYNNAASNGEKRPELPKKPTDVGHYARLLPAIIAIAVIVISVLYSLTLSTNPSIETLGDQPSPYRELNEYAAAVDEILQQDLSNRTKFTIQTNKVEDALLDKYPELQAAVLRLPVLGRKPTMVIEVRQPTLLLSVADNTYVLDKNGVAIVQANQLSAADKQGLPVVIDHSGINVEVGQQVLTTETINFILDARDQLAAKQLKITSLVLPVSINELDIQIEGLPYFVKTDTSGDARLQIGTALAVKDNLQGQGTMPSEYVDVRVEEKAFYR